MIDFLSSAGLRRWAMQCAAAADDPFASGDDRARLLTMRSALLEWADTQDWLDGKGRQQQSAVKQQPLIKLSA